MRKQIDRTPVDETNVMVTLAWNTHKVIVTVGVVTKSFYEDHHGDEIFIDDNSDDSLQLSKNSEL